MGGSIIPEHLKDTSNNNPDELKENHSDEHQNDNRPTIGVEVDIPKNEMFVGSDDGVMFNKAQLSWDDKRMDTNVSMSDFKEYMDKHPQVRDTFNHIVNSYPDKLESAFSNIDTTKINTPEDLVNSVFDSARQSGVILEGRQVDNNISFDRSGEKLSFSVGDTKIQTNIPSKDFSAQDEALIEQHSKVAFSPIIAESLSQSNTSEDLTRKFGLMAGEGLPFNNDNSIFMNEVKAINGQDNEIKNNRMSVEILDNYGGSAANLDAEGQEVNQGQGDNLLQRDIQGQGDNLSQRVPRPTIIPNLARGRRDDI
jgi:hypothetical protein